MPLTHEHLRELLSYDPLTGVFLWRIATGRLGCHRAHEIAGTLSSRGYVVISIDSKLYKAHRLAWLYVHGVWPPHMIDHKDTIRDHNWLDNLRLATRSENAQNVRGLRSNNTSGVTGVYWDIKALKWVAQIRINGNKKSLGHFESKEAAIEARSVAEALHHPFKQKDERPQGLRRTA